MIHSCRITFSDWLWNSDSVHLRNGSLWLLQSCVVSVDWGGRFLSGARMITAIGLLGCQGWLETCGALSDAVHWHQLHRELSAHHSLGRLCAQVLILLAFWSDKDVLCVYEIVRWHWSGLLRRSRLVLRFLTRISVVEPIGDINGAVAVFLIDQCQIRVLIICRWNRHIS